MLSWIHFLLAKREDTGVFLQVIPFRTKWRVLQINVLITSCFFFVFFIEIFNRICLLQTSEHMEHVGLMSKTLINDNA